MSEQWIKDWKVPTSGFKMYKSDGEVLCIADFNSDTIYAINKHYPMIAVYKKRGQIPRMKKERIFSKQEEMYSFIERTQNRVIIAN